MDFKVLSFKLPHKRKPFVRPSPPALFTNQTNGICILLEESKSDQAEENGGH